MTRDEEARQRDLSAAIRDKADYHVAPEPLIEAVRASLPSSNEDGVAGSRIRFWFIQSAALAGVAFITWAATMGYLRPNEDERIAGEVLASHVRATLGNRPIEVASSDQHTVKPWLSGRLPFSPPVADHSGQGFELRGARLDHVDGRPVAVLVYARRLHLIDVYVRPAQTRGAERSLTRHGFNLEHFSSGEMDYWLLSDLNRNELRDFARLLALAAAG